MKRVLSIIIAALIIGAGIVLWTNSNKDKQSSNTNTSTDMSDMDMPTNTSQSSNSNSSTETTQTNAVTIKDFAFGPTSITVKKGTKVTWTNQDAVGHDVTPDNPSDEFKQSDLLSKGESYSVTFNTVGTFTYFCSPHPYMKAKVIVTE